jgi:hypothetical protein
MNNEKPYIVQFITTAVYKYNPNYGDDRICQCGHVYYRHFDSWDEMAHVGCKYCWCHDFQEADVSPKNIQKMRDEVYAYYELDEIAFFLDKNDSRSIDYLIEYHYRMKSQQELENTNEV